MATAPQLIHPTNEELLLREDGIERSIIRGELREKPKTICNRFRGRIMARLVTILSNWVDLQPEPNGVLHCGNAGCRLSRHPETIVGIDIVYRSPELAARDPQDTVFIDGAPTLVVDILSPGDVQGEIVEKVDCYLEAGVPLIWIIEPHFMTVTIYRPGHKPVLVNRTQELSAEPELPGFRVAVAELFQ